MEKGSVKAEVPADRRVMVKTLRKNTEKARSGTLHSILSDNSGKCNGKEYLSGYLYFAFKS